MVKEDQQVFLPWFTVYWGEKDGKQVNYKTQPNQGKPKYTDKSWLNGNEDLQDSWVDGWMGKWMSRWVGGWMDGWVGGCVDGWVGGWKKRQQSQVIQGNLLEERYYFIHSPKDS